MKIKILLFLLAFSGISQAQDTDDRKIYLDSTFAVTDEVNHVYYQIIKDYKRNKKEYSVTQYYKSGQKESEGISTSKDVLRRKGQFTYYYENGNKRTSVLYDDEANKNGNCTFWYDNGEIKFEGEFIKSTFTENSVEKTTSTLKINNYWTAEKVQTVIAGNGNYTDDGFFDYMKSNSVSSGKLVNGFKEGVWTGKNDMLGITFSETYENGKLISGVSKDSKNEEYTYDKLYWSAEPNDGMTNFYKYVGKTFRTPEDIGKGKIVTQFTVSVDGEISNLRTIKEFRPDVDQEAIRVISEFKNFKAAKFRGVKIKSNYTLPISIQGS